MDVFQKKAIFARRKFRKLLQHLLFWITYMTYEALIAYFAGISIKLPQLFISFGINALIFYSSLKIYQIAVRRYQNLTLMITVTFLSLSVLICGSSYLKMFLDELLNHHTISLTFEKLRFVSLIMRGIYFALMGLSYGLALQAIVRQKEAAINKVEKLKLMERQSRTEKEVVTANLNFLRAQINPHFLFNTLGLLHAETYKAAPEAGAKIILLSNIMRYALTRDTGGYVSLDTELNYIEDFIQIHNGRTQSFFLNFKLPDNRGAYQIISLVLVTLVENIFKHGVLNHSAKEASLIIEIKDNKLFYKSFNHKKINCSLESNYIGLNYVQKRLLHEFGEDFVLSFHDQADTYECTLVMPLIPYETN